MTVSIVCHILFLQPNRVERISLEDGEYTNITVRKLLTRVCNKLQSDCSSYRFLMCSVTETPFVELDNTDLLLGHLGARSGANLYIQKRLSFKFDITNGDTSSETTVTLNLVDNATNLVSVKDLQKQLAPQLKLEWYEFYLKVDDDYWDESQEIYLTGLVSLAQKSAWEYLETSLSEKRRILYYFPHKVNELLFVDKENKVRASIKCTENMPFGILLQKLSDLTGIPIADIELYREITPKHYVPFKASNVQKPLS